MCAHTNICFTFLRCGLFERISVICSVCPHLLMPPTITPYTQIFHKVIGSRLFHIYLRHKCIFVSGWGKSELWGCFVEGHFSSIDWVTVRDHFQVTVVVSSSSSSITSVKWTAVFSHALGVYWEKSRSAWEVKHFSFLLEINRKQHN